MSIYDKKKNKKKNILLLLAGLILLVLTVFEDGVYAGVKDPDFAEAAASSDSFFSWCTFLILATID